MIEAVVCAIDDRAIGEDGCEALPARLEDIIRAGDVQITLVLTATATAAPYSASSPTSATVSFCRGPTAIRNRRRCSAPG
jgi:hypothetical protein